MISAARLLMFCSVILTGCGTVRTAAVTTFRVVDAPARYVRERIDSPRTTTTTTTTTEASGTSDVVTPGRPVNPPSQTSSSEARIATQDREPSSNRQTPTTGTEAATTPRKSSPSRTPRAAVPKSAEFPTARAVPGKPGYVYSIDPKGGIVDVTGYQSGDKAKDPYTKQIFIVP